MKWISSRARVLATGLALVLFAASSPSAALADDGVDVVVRARFTTEADADAIQQATCRPDTRVRVGSEPVPAAVRVERKDAVIACAAAGDEKRTLVVHIGEPENGQREVVVDMDLGQEGSLERADEMLDAVAITSAEIRRRLPVPAPRTRALSPTLTALGITLGAVGLGAVIASYIWTAVLVVQPQQCSGLSVTVPVFGSCVSASAYLQTEVLAIAGYATMGLGTVLALVGQLRVAAAKKSARITPVVTPVRGGLTGGLTFAF